jgi:hypothetical protein
MKLDQTVQLKIAHSLKSEPKNRLIQGGGPAPHSSSSTSRNYRTKIPPEFKLIYINCHRVAESFLFLVSRHMRARSGDHGSRSESGGRNRLQSSPNCSGVLHGAPDGGLSSNLLFILMLQVIYGRAYLIFHLEEFVLANRKICFIKHFSKQILTLLENLLNQMSHS